MKYITDPSFKYTCALETDLEKTFARVRRERRGPSPGQKVTAIGAGRSTQRLIACETATARRNKSR